MGSTDSGRAGGNGITCVRQAATVGLTRALVFGCVAALGVSGPVVRESLAADAPTNGIPLPLTGKVTVRNDGVAYIVRGACVIPSGSEIRIERDVRVVGVENASLDVRGGLSVHGTEDHWVRFFDIDLSPTQAPGKMMHLDMVSLHGCRLVHAEGAAFAGGITIENSCWQGDCTFDVRLASGFLRIMTTEFVCPCKVTATAGKGKATEFAIRTSWMKETTIRGPAAGTLRHSEFRGVLELHDVSDMVVDGNDLFGGMLVRQVSPASFGKISLTKCNLALGTTVRLERPAGPEVKAERVALQRFFYEGENGEGLLSEKAVAEFVVDGVDDPAHAVKAVLVQPNKRRHVFLSESLRQRAPPVGGGR